RADVGVHGLQLVFRLHDVGPAQQNLGAEPRRQGRQNRRGAVERGGQEVFGQAGAGGQLERGQILGGLGGGGGHGGAGGPPRRLGLPQVELGGDAGVEAAAHDGERSVLRLQRRLRHRQAVAIGAERQPGGGGFRDQGDLGRAAPLVGGEVLLEGRFG